MSQYKAVRAVIVKGDRIERNAVIELTAEEAARYGDDFVPFNGTSKPVAKAPEPEKALEDMKLSELQEKAKSLGLSTSGTKSDLVERIEIYQTSEDSEDESEEGSESDEDEELSEDESEEDEE